MNKIIDSLKQKLINDQKIIKKLISTTITRGLAAVGTFVFNFVLAKYLDVSSFGYFMLAYSILIGLGFIVKIGMPFAIMRFAGIMSVNKEFGKIKKLRKDVSILTIAISTFLGLGLIILKNYISFKFFDNIDVGNMLIMFAFSLPFYSFLTIQSSFMKAFKRPEIAPIFEVGLTTFLTGAGVALLAFFGLKIDSFLASVIFFLASIIVVTIGHFTLNRIIKKETKGVFFKTERYQGFYKTLPDYALSSIAGYLLKFSPTIILGLYASGKDIGLYSLANSTAFIINFVLWIINTVYAPHFASSYSHGKIKELRNLVRNSILYMLAIAVPIFLIIISFPSTILSFFGEEFVEAKTALIIMAVAQLFNVSTGPVYFLLNMTGHQRYLRNIVIITAILSISGSLVLVPLYGFIGAAIATALGLIIQNSFAFYHSNKHLNLKILTFKS